MHRTTGGVKKICSAVDGGAKLRIFFRRKSCGEGKGVRCGMFD